MQENTRIQNLKAKAQAEEERLKEIKNRIRLEEMREAKRKRAADTRRKILLGAMHLDRMERSEDYRDNQLEQLDEFLTRPRDRQLFGLSIPDDQPAATSTTTERESGTSPASAQALGGSTP